MGDTQENAIKIGMISRRITKHHQSGRAVEESRGLQERTNSTSHPYRILALANSSLHLPSGTLYGYFAFAHLACSIRSALSSVFTYWSLVSGSVSSSDSTKNKPPSNSCRNAHSTMAL